MWRLPKITVSILGELRKDRISEQARVKTTTENEKDNIKVCSLSLSLDVLFLYLAKGVDSFFIFCFSLLDDY